MRLSGGDAAVPARLDAPRSEGLGIPETSDTLGVDSVVLLWLAFRSFSTFSDKLDSNGEAVKDEGEVVSVDSTGLME